MVVGAEIAEELAVGAAAGTGEEEETGEATADRTAQMVAGAETAEGMAAAGTGHAALDHAHFKLTATGAGFPAIAIQVDDLLLGIRFQPHAFALDEPCGDQVAFDHPADGGQNRWDVFALHPSAAARVEYGL